MTAGLAIAAAVVENLVLEELLVQTRLLDAVVRRKREEEPVAAAQHGAIVDAEVHAEARRRVVGVMWRAWLQSRWRLPQPAVLVAR